MRWHDGHMELEGFKGYDRAEVDPNGVSPEGINGDLYERPKFEPTNEQLRVVHLFETGQLDRTAAESMLDALAEEQAF